MEPTDKKNYVTGADVLHVFLGFLSIIVAGVILLALTVGVVIRIIRWVGGF